MLVKLVIRIDFSTGCSLNILTCLDIHLIMPYYALNVAIDVVWLTWTDAISILHMGKYE